MRLLLLAALTLAPAAGRAQDVEARLADLRLATAVRLALAADPATAPLDAAVHARAGAVALAAAWPSADAEARALAVARGVEGVVEVTLGDGPPAPPARLDEGAAEPVEAGEDAGEAEAAELPREPERPAEPERRAPEPRAEPDPKPEPIRVEPEPVRAEPAPVEVEPAEIEPEEIEPEAAVPEPRGGWNAPPPADEAPPGAVYHTVLLGDTLFSIARRYGTTVEALQRLNGLGAATGLALGQRLRVR